MAKFIIFEDHHKTTCKEFIDAVSELVNDDVILVMDGEFDPSLITEPVKLVIFSYSQPSMVYGELKVKESCSHWYAVHLRRFTEKDLSGQYNDRDKNAGTFIPHRGEDMKTFANRVVTTILGK